MKNLGYLLATALVGTGAFVGAAHAQTQSAMAGHAWPNPVDSCFNSSFAMVTNNCETPTTRLWIIPIQVPTAGNYTASARVAGAPAYTQATCQAMAINSSNSGWSFGNVRGSSGSAVQNIPLGNINVPAQGTAHFECQVGGWVSDLNGGGRGARVINVELNPL
ncbi:MAG TPA: hypothetical protein VGC41_21290 [Kofleriaceae bacterium]